MPFVVAGLIVLAWLSLTVPAHAKTWCVPSEDISTSCTHSANRLQTAINASAVGSVILIGPNTAAERVTIDKRLTIRCLPGAVLTDAGLGASTTRPVLHYTGEYSSPRLEHCTILVDRGAGGILVDPTVGFLQIKGTVVESTRIPKPAYGVRAYDNPRTWFIGGRDTGPRPTIRGFAVGFDSRNNGWLNIEAGAQGGVLIQSNDVGIRTIHDKGQLFYNQAVGNGVGIEVRGGFHADINANEFHHNGVGLVWGLAATPNPDSKCTTQKTMEMNHSVFSGNGTPMRVETTPGVYSTDYRDDPGTFVQWTNMTINGTLMPNHNARVGVCIP